MAVENVAHDLRAAGERRAVDDRLLAAEHPVIGVDAFDARPCFIAGHEGRLAQERRLGALLLERGLRALEHVHQRAFADGKSEQVVERRAQPFVREELQALHIDGKRMNARSERRAQHGGRQRRRRRHAAARALDRKATMPPHEGPDRRKLDLVGLAHERPLGFVVERQPATETMRRRVILEGVGVFGQAARVAFMPRLGAAGLGVLALLFAIGRRRLRGIARGLLRPLKPQDQFDQLLFRKALQLVANYLNFESSRRKLRKTLAKTHRKRRNCQAHVTRG